MKINYNEPMAKEDFCYTYYDGDAARDKAHLNRLQRGAYDDLISAQRKFGHLTIEQIKRVLGNDFEYCWEPLQWILCVDGEGKLYIEWVERSVEKMRRHSKKQKENAEKRWKKDATAFPPHHSGISQTPSQTMPLEDGNGDENENKNFGKFENLLLDVDLLIEKIILDQNYRQQCEMAGYPPSKLNQWMYAFNRFLKFKGVTKSNEPGWRLGFPAWMAYHDYRNGEDPENYSPVKWAKQKKEDADKILNVNGTYKQTSKIGKSTGAENLVDGLAAFLKTTGTGNNQD